MEKVFICLKNIVRCDKVCFGYGMWKCFVFQGILGFGLELEWDIEWEIGLNF